MQLARDGQDACRDCAEALALGRVYERAGTDDRVPERAGALARADACYARAAESRTADVEGEALYRLALRHRRERRFEEAAAIWRQVLELTEPRGVRRIDRARGSSGSLPPKRWRSTTSIASGTSRAPGRSRSSPLEEADGRRADGVRHRLARLDRKIAKKTDAQLLWS